MQCKTDLAQATDADMGCIKLAKDAEYNYYLWTRAPGRPRGGPCGPHRPPDHPMHQTFDYTPPLAVL
jgi:hypothetical protein